MYFRIYKTYLLKYETPDKETFKKFIEYSKTYYNNINYSIDRFYEKVKKCYEFIIYFLNNGKTLIWIKNTVFRGGLTYTKLYKIKNDDYLNLLKFFIDKEDIYVISGPNDSEYTDNECYSDSSFTDDPYEE